MVYSVRPAVWRRCTVQCLDSGISILDGGEVHETKVMGPGFGAHRSWRADDLAHGPDGPACEEIAHLNVESILIANLRQATHVQSSSFLLGSYPPRGSIVANPAIVGVGPCADILSGHLLCLPPQVIGLGWQTVSGRGAPLGLVVDFDGPTSNWLTWQFFQSLGSILLGVKVDEAVAWTPAVERVDGYIDLFAGIVSAKSVARLCGCGRWKIALTWEYHCRRRAARHRSSGQRRADFLHICKSGDQ